MEESQNQGSKKGRIDDLRDKIYSPNVQFKDKTRRELKAKSYEVEHEWPGGVDPEKDVEEPKEEQKKVSIFTKITILAFIFFLGALSYGAYVFYSGLPSNSGEDVDITVIGPVSIGGGEELSLDIIIENNNQVSLETVDLVIEYPNGSKQVKDLRQDLDRERDILGDIMPNSIVKRTKGVVLFGEEGDEKQIEIKVEYRIDGSTAIFEKKKVFDIVIQSSPVRLVIDTDKEINPDQPLTFDIDVISNSNKKLENIIIEAQYPFGFRLAEGNIETVEGNNVWNLGSLMPKEKKRLTIVGSLQGQDREERVFKFKAGIAGQDKPNELAVLFTTSTETIFIKRPFFELDIAIENSVKSVHIEEERTTIRGEIKYVNNTPTNINDARIELKLNGDVLDEFSIDTNGGFYDSITNTIVWDKNTNAIFKEIKSGDHNTLTFTFRSKKLASATELFKNPQITLDAKVTGRRVSEESVPEDIESKTVSTVKFISDVDISTKTSHVSGPLPPQTEKESVYKITWNLTNSSNKLINGKLITTLPNYVTWNSKVSSNNEKVTYDAVSRQVTWNLGEINEHTGYTFSPREISFEVTLLPSISQLGDVPVLVNGPRFTAIDTFTDTSISFNLLSQTTETGSQDDFTNSRVVGSE